MTESERQPEDRRERIIRLTAYFIVALEFVFIFMPTIRYPRNYGRFFVLGFAVGDFFYYASWSFVICGAIWRYWIPSLAEEYGLKKETVWAASLPIMFFVCIVLAPSVAPLYCP